MNASSPAKRHIQDVDDAITSDCKRVCNPDIHRPFSSLKDVVERLLPYHLVASEDVDHANQRDLNDLGAQTIVSRQDAWIGYSTKKSVELEKQRAKLSNRIEAYESSEFEKSEILRIAICTFTEAETKRELDAEAKKAKAEEKVAAEKRAELEAGLENPPSLGAVEESAKVKAATEQIESGGVQATQGLEKKKEIPPVGASAQGNAPNEQGQSAVLPTDKPQPKKEDVRAKLLAAGLKLKLNKR